MLYRVVAFTSMLFLLSAANARNISCSLGLGIDTANNSEAREVFLLWAAYLSSNPDSIYNNPCWNEEEKKRYTSYDLLRSEGWLSPSLYGLQAQNTVLGIENKTDHFIIRSIFYWIYPNKTMKPLAVTKTVAKKENGKLRLFNYLPYHTQVWEEKKVGRINYRYYPGYAFNLSKAQRANDFIQTLSKAFQVKIDTVDYYIAENCDEIMRLKGFDYVIGMYSQTNLCGFYDQHNNIIYSNSTEGEYYQHELVHLVNRFFPAAHGLLLNGLSVYMNTGGSVHMGKPFLYHLERINTFLNQHPDIDLDTLSGFYQMDGQTTPSYFLGAILCHEILKKGGTELLKRALRSGNTDEDLYTLIAQELGVRQKNLNKYLRERISFYASAGNFVPYKI